MSDRPPVAPSTGEAERELTAAEIQNLLRKSRRYARRRNAARTALDLAGSARLKAQSKLWEDAADLVLAKWPRYCDDIEQVLWPAFAEYSRTVFDEVAGRRSESLTSRFSLRRYTHWLRFTCVAAVVDEDVCHPSGQLFATVQHVIDVIGDSRRANQIDETKRSLYRMLTDFLGGPYVQNLEKRLSALLNGRVAHWEGEARERVFSKPQTEATVRLDAAPPNQQTLERAEVPSSTVPPREETCREEDPKPEAPGTTPQMAANPAAIANRVGREVPIQSATGANIDRLRKECGWSFDELAAKTGLEKKLALGHVNKGKGIRARTLKMYADAFAKGLNRSVTVAEVEGREHK